jgi:hypothetical protein
MYMSLTVHTEETLAEARKEMKLYERLLHVSFQHSLIKRPHK